MNGFLLFYWAFSTLVICGVCITTSDFKNRNFATVTGAIIGSTLFGCVVFPLFLGMLLAEMDNSFKEKKG